MAQGEVAEHLPRLGAGNDDKDGVRLATDVLSGLRLEIEIEARYAAAERLSVMPPAV